MMDDLIKEALIHLKKMIADLEEAYIEEEEIIKKDLILSPNDIRMLYGAQGNIAILYENLQYYKTIRELNEKTTTESLKNYIKNPGDTSTEVPDGIYR